MKIKVKYHFKSYSKLLTQVFYSQIKTILVVGLGILMVFAGCFFLYKVPWKLFSVLVLFTLGLILILLPLITSKMTARRSFYSNKMLQEKLEFEFVGDAIKTRGESFTTEMKWISIHKVKELKGWFLLYHSKQSFYMIPKESLGNKQSEFIDIIKNQKGLTYKLLE